MKIDFQMTYPCYSPMVAVMVPCTFMSEDDLCVALMTDEDAVNEFIRHKTMRCTLREKLPSPKHVSDYLIDMSHGVSNGKRVTHVLIDPGNPSKSAPCYPILEFAAHVLQQGE